MEGSLIGWVANHRRHHVFSDRPGDPHSPHEYDGAGHRPAARLRRTRTSAGCSRSNATSAERFAPDLVRDTDVAIISRLFPLFAVFSLAAPFFLGWAWSGTIGGALTALLVGRRGAHDAAAPRDVERELDLSHVREAARDRQGPEHQLRAARRASRSARRGTTSTTRTRARRATARSRTRSIRRPRSSASSNEPAGPPTCTGRRSRRSRPAQTLIRRVSASRHCDRNPRACLCHADLRSCAQTVAHRTRRGIAWPPKSPDRAGRSRARA